jgi:hypothetical protein
VRGFRRGAHQTTRRCQSGPPVPSRLTLHQPTRCAPLAHSVPIYYNAVILKFRTCTYVVKTRKLHRNILLRMDLRFSENSKNGMVQKRPFSGNTRDLSAYPDRSPRWCGFTRAFSCRVGASVLGEPSVPQKFQPVSMRLTRQQLRGTFADSTGVFTAQVSTVVQEELKQRQVVLPQLPP